MAVYDFQAISTPIMESIQQHGALFSACAETLPGETSWLPSRDPAVSEQAMAIEYSLPRTKHFLLHNFKGQHCISLSNSNAKGTVRPKTLFASARLTKHRRYLSSGTRQNWLELASECLMWQTLRAGGSTAWEISDSQDGVLQPVSVCLWPLTHPVVKRKQVLYIFFSMWLWVPGEVIQKFYYQYRQW